MNNFTLSLDLERNFDVKNIKVKSNKFKLTTYSKGSNTLYYMPLSSIEGNMKEFLGGQSFPIRNKKEFVEKSSHALGLNASYILIIPLSKEILLVRDRVGVTPIYYYCEESFFVVSSHINLLAEQIKTPLSLNWNGAMGLGGGMYDFMSFDYETYLEGAYMMPEGNFISIDINNDLSINEYWKIKDQNEQYLDFSSTKDAVAHCKNIVNESIHSRIGNKSVNSNVLFSGGLDSSIICAALARNNIHVNAFIAMNALNIENGDMARASEISTRYKLNSWFISRKSPNEFSSLTSATWKSLLWITETPKITGPMLGKSIAFKGIQNILGDSRTALFSGMGSDQFNGGSLEYITGYEGDDEREQWKCFERKIETMQKEKAISHNTKNVLRFKKYVKPAFLYSLMNKEYSETPWIDLLESYKRKMSKRYLAPTQKLADHFNIELIYPFLDYQLLEFYSKVNPKHYEDLFLDKKVLRKAFEDEVGKEISSTIKLSPVVSDAHSPYHFMLRHVYSDKNYSLLEEALEEIKAYYSHIFDYHQLYSVFRGFPNEVSASDFDILIELFNTVLLFKMLKEKTGEKRAIDTDIFFYDLESYIKNSKNIQKEIKATGEIDFEDENLMFVVTDGHSLLRESGGTLFIACSNILVYEITNKEWADVLDDIFTHKKMKLGEIIKDRDFVFVKSIIEHLLVGNIITVST